jgi:asparagine synthase (glutamine-hydrolysing)
MGSATLDQFVSPQDTNPNGCRSRHWVARAHPGERHLHFSSDGESAASVAQRPDVTVAFEGVLYNRAELLHTLGFASAPTTDAELIAAAYRRWGSDVPQHLKGIFAIVVADESERLIFAARDPLGAYPLFFARSSSGLLFSTSIDLLREQPGVARDVNRAALADHLCHRWPDQHETFFSSIWRVPPGYAIRATAHDTRVSRYWEPVPPGRDVAWITEGEVQERFESAFERAVEHTFAFGPTGLFLSGGLDSISVGAMAADLARQGARPLPFALSLGFPGEADEETEQRGVAKRLGLQHELVQFEEAVPDRLLDRALEIGATRPAPLLNTWLPGYVELTRRAKQRGVRTILSGAGGDEWLGVTPCYAADLIRSGKVRELAQLIRGWDRSYELGPVNVLRALLWHFGARPLASSVLGTIAPRRWKANRVGRGVRSTLAWVAPDAGLRRTLDARVEAFLPAARPERSFYLQDVRASLEHTLTSMELEEIFETGRRLDVRYLHPYWDAEVVDMLYRTPPLLLFSGGLSKSVVRHTMARRFPGLGLERQKKRAGTSFYRKILNREIPDLWRRKSGLEALADLGVVDPRQAAAMAERSIANTIGTGLVRTWDLMNLETWVRTHQ